MLGLKASEGLLLAHQLVEDQAAVGWLEFTGVRKDWG